MWFLAMSNEDGYSTILSQYTSIRTAPSVDKESMKPRTGFSSAFLVSLFNKQNQDSRILCRLHHILNAGVAVCKDFGSSVCPVRPTQTVFCRGDWPVFAASPPPSGAAPTSRGESKRAHAPLGQRDVRLCAGGRADFCRRKNVVCSGHLKSHASCTSSFSPSSKM